jgi:hypothetical protein
LTCTSTVGEGSKFTFQFPVEIVPLKIERKKNFKIITKEPTKLEIVTESELDDDDTDSEFNEILTKIETDRDIDEKPDQSIIIVADD